MTPTQTIPNRPSLIVAVDYIRPLKMHFGRMKGKSALVPMRFVGASAREVSAELSDEDRVQFPVIWRLLKGAECGGDDPKSEPPWQEVRVEIPSTVADARSHLEKHLFGEEHRWFILESSQGPARFRDE